MADSKKYEDYGKPTLQQGGWMRTGEGNDYIQYTNPADTNYYYRICTLDYIPQHHPTQITITGIASKELEVSVVVLRSDNYIIASLGWQDNGYTFNLGSTYDKLGVMFRFKNGDAITPNDVTFDDVGAWQHSLRKLGTSTDTLTTLPVDLYADGNNATVGLLGNMSQTGTPSPQNPIQPSECGERTGNLLATLTENYAIDASGNINSNNSFMYYTASCEANETYTFSLDSGLSGSTVRIHAFNGDTWIEQLSGRNINLAPFTVTTPASTTNLKISITKDAKTYHTMLNVGETALPYEPYGYKLDIKSANTTTPVYLGEVESTRKIKKYEFTGLEGWIVRSGTPENVFFCERQGVNFINNAAICSHYANQDSGSFNDLQDKHFIVRIASSGDKTNFGIRDSSYPSTNEGVNQLKTYLQQQYAAGTPVAVWYVLAEPTTGMVNEPLRKIGNYADTVSGVSIPTITGKDTFDVQTSLKPSEVSLAYTGWHDASVGEWDGSQWQ